MVEPPLNERSQRQEMAAMMFETFKVLVCSWYSKCYKVVVVRYSLWRWTALWRSWSWLSRRRFVQG